MNKDTKATIAILSFFVIFGLIVIIPLLISHNKKTEEVNKKNFPSYEEITIDESVFGDDSKYEDVREQLENDYYFSKFAAVFFSTFIIFTVPFVAELIISFICLPASAHGDPTNREFYKTAVEIYDYPFSELFINNRFLWLLLAVVLFGMVSGVLAVFNAAVSSNSKIKYAIFTMISVYILLNICSTFQLEYLTNYFLILRLFISGKNYMAYAMTLVVLICFSVGIMTAHIKKDELI